MVQFEALILLVDLVRLGQMDLMSFQLKLQVPVSLLKERDSVLF